MVEPVGSHPSSSLTADSTSLEDSATTAAEQASDVADAVPVAAAAAIASNGMAPVSDAAVPRTRKKRKKRRATSESSQHPAVSATSRTAATQRGAGQIVPYAAATAAVIGGALLLRRLLRRTSAQQQQPDGGDRGPPVGAHSLQRDEKRAGDVVDIPVVGASPALVLELDPPLRRGADAASGGACPLLDGLTFAVSDVYVPLDRSRVLRVLCMSSTLPITLVHACLSTGMVDSPVMNVIGACVRHMSRGTATRILLSFGIGTWSKLRCNMIVGCRRFDIEGVITRSGRDAGIDDPPPAAVTAAALQLLVDAGATGVAKSATPPMNLGCASQT